MLRPTMIFISILCAIPSLRTVAASQTVHQPFDVPKVFEITIDGVSVPNLKQDFSKNNVSAQWAPGYPKNWGSEDFTLTDGILDPEPFHELNAAFTADEKYVAIMNASHIVFIDLDKNVTATSTKLAPEGDTSGKQATLRQAPNGEYDVFTTAIDVVDGAINTFRQRFSSSLKPIGNVSLYPGRVSSYSDNFRMSTTTGAIYDFSLPTNNTTLLTHIPIGKDTLSSGLSPDGQYLYTSDYSRGADDYYIITLWNATSGQRIGVLPADMKKINYVKFSSDSKYMATCGGAKPTVIKFYSVDNITAPAVVLPLSFYRRYDPVQWRSPDGGALSSSEGPSLSILRLPGLELEQKLEMDHPSTYIEDVTWLDDGRKIAFLFHYGRWIYDFETNTKWWMNIRSSDHLWAVSRVMYLKKREMFVTVDGDATMRFWKA